MRFLPLASGSQGNATVVEFDGTRLLLDAGLAAKELAARLEACDVEPASIDAILLSHEHQDHVRGAQKLSKHFGIPVAASWATLQGMDRSPQAFAGWIDLPVDHGVRIGAVTVVPFPVPHDAAAPVGFVLEGDSVRIGVATDLGHATPQIAERLSGCDLLMIESNHDPLLLRDGPYPWRLKDRVAGKLGHLSNSEAAALIKHSVDERCRCIVLAHLSEKNNTPELARSSALRALRARGCERVEVKIARFDRPMAAVHL
ncbi:MAG: MBL fold metallo-hydrolase [Acidobacteria bacterium]|nr:MBL fold metallo-hydrolase [Acidobacteriota bacterium]NIM60835.1 MBL fold metallo-hydrolase [Acidobacteriota bacterium]NIO58686.1 MBL fold metallo-hydrolase [Acidobacteriota bacterium]NIQ29742.1 MBL fold metallo-hydrolase [Acidobacteriota bacterium]NIQ84466.1 MBL fold metallo-hydrolase [Acidobacteriota bacterium]